MLLLQLQTNFIDESIQHERIKQWNQVTTRNIALQYWASAYTGVTGVSYGDRATSYEWYKLRFMSGQGQIYGRMWTIVPWPSLNHAYCLHKFCQSTAIQQIHREILPTNYTHTNYCYGFQTFNLVIVKQYDGSLKFELLNWHVIYMSIDHAWNIISIHFSPFHNIIF